MKPRTRNHPVINELKPCPWCNGEAETEKTVCDFSIRCRKCHVSMVVRSEKGDEIIRRWNNAYCWKSSVITRKMWDSIWDNFYFHLKKEPQDGRSQAKSIIEKCVNNALRKGRKK